MNIGFAIIWLFIVFLMAAALFYPVPQRAKAPAPDTGSDPLESTAVSMTTTSTTETATATATATSTPEVPEVGAHARRTTMATLAKPASVTTAGPDKATATQSESARGSQL
ncbi:hypothetical protein BJY01DRAFT_248894 [Aspergillus pseudoustus]|uniref:Uncharacterized protein n=1 Tax=Aspergillus pseudoustus TaxID=1810923 RepID=A0ABR4JSD9_9EURO